MAARIRKFLSLSAREKLLLMRAASQLLWVSAALRLLPFSIVKRSCERLREHAASDPVSISQVAYAVNAATNFIPGSACLSRALVCQRMLGNIGVRTQLKIGVMKKAKGMLDAHAWLEYEGMVIMGGSSELSMYSRL